MLYLSEVVIFLLKYQRLCIFTPYPMKYPSKLHQQVNINKSHSVTIFLAKVTIFWFLPVTI